MRRTGSPERWTRAKTTTDTPSPTMAAWLSRRKRKGSASGLRVGVADPDGVVVQSLEGLGGQLLALLGVEGLLVVADGFEQIARGIEVTERGEVGLEALHGVRRVPRAVDEGVVEGVLELRGARALVVLRPLEDLELGLDADLVPVTRDDLHHLLGERPAADGLPELDLEAARISGLGEELLGLRRIIRIGAGVEGVRHIAAGDGVEDLPASVEEILDDGLA